MKKVNLFILFIAICFFSCESNENWKDSYQTNAPYVMDSYNEYWWLANNLYSFEGEPYDLTLSEKDSLMVIQRDLDKMFIQALVSNNTAGKLKVFLEEFQFLNRRQSLNGIPNLYPDLLLNEDGTYLIKPAYLDNLVKSFKNNKKQVYDIGDILCFKAGGIIYADSLGNPDSEKNGKLRIQFSVIDFNSDKTIMKIKINDFYDIKNNIYNSGFNVDGSHPNRNWKVGTIDTVRFYKFKYPIIECQ